VIGHSLTFDVILSLRWSALPEESQRGGHFPLKMTGPEYGAQLNAIGIQNVHGERCLPIESVQAV
jgi:hypothetical protein